MRKCILSTLVLSGVVANAQNDYSGRVGINTSTPRATLEVSAVDYGANSTKAQGILFPHISDAEKDKWKKDDAKGLVAGTVIWNTDKNCLDYFDGTLWQCVDGSKKSTPGNQTITLPPQLKIANGEHWIVSIYDTKYLPHAVPTVAASWTRGEEGGTDPKIDIKGKVPAGGISVKIPITATANATLPAYTAYALTPAEAWNDRTEKILELSWEQQALTTSSKTLTATIKVKNATTDQYLTQLDIEKGLGDEYKGLLLGQFKMPSGYTETTPNAYTGTYDVRVISGIPDRNFGKKTQLTGSTTAELLHQFIYLPIKAEDGKIWLNNNLGAEYADTNNKRGFFNPAQQATAKDDYKAFGSLFQWQRQADGHELITWKAGDLVNSTKSNSVQGPINADWVAPANDTNFYANNSSPYSWVSASYNSSNHTYWQSGGKNNPCPTGFHVPTHTEWSNLHTKSGGSHNDDWWAQTSTLKLTAAGDREYNDGMLHNTLSLGAYWSSEMGGGYSYYYTVGSRGSVHDTVYRRSSGFSVRCLKD